MLGPGEGAGVGGRGREYRVGADAHRRGSGLTCVASL